MKIAERRSRGSRNSRSGGEWGLRRAGRAGLRDRAGAAGEDHRLGADLGEGLFRALERRDLAIDAGLAYAPRDELRHLRAEIDDERLVVTIGDLVVEVVHASLSLRHCEPKAKQSRSRGSDLNCDGDEAAPGLLRYARNDEPPMRQT